MSDDKFEKLFKWVDILRYVLVGLVGAAVGVAVWATRIQNAVEANKTDIAASQANVQHSRDIRNEKEIKAAYDDGRRDEALEWLKKGYKDK